MKGAVYIEAICEECLSDLEVHTTACGIIQVERCGECLKESYDEGYEVGRRAEQA